jgi:hypothetical protein
MPQQAELLAQGGTEHERLGQAVPGRQRAQHGLQQREAEDRRRDVGDPHGRERGHLARRQSQG